MSLLCAFHGETAPNTAVATFPFADFSAEEINLEPIEAQARVRPRRDIGPISENARCWRMSRRFCPAGTNRLAEMVTASLAISQEKQLG